MVTITGVDQNGDPSDIYFGMCQDAAEELIEALLSKDEIKLVVLERDDTDQQIIVEK
jgi:hypothetical protein